MKSKTDRADYAFPVKERPGGGWQILLEPRHQNLAILKDGFITLEFEREVTEETVRIIARGLSEGVASVSHTSTPYEPMPSGTDIGEVRRQPSEPLEGYMSYRQLPDAGIIGLHKAVETFFANTNPISTAQKETFMAMVSDLQPYVEHLEGELEQRGIKFEKVTWGRFAHHRLNLEQQSPTFREAYASAIRLLELHLEEGVAGGSSDYPEEVIYQYGVQSAFAAFQEVAGLHAGKSDGSLEKSTQLKAFCSAVENFRLEALRKIRAD